MRISIRMLYLLSFVSCYAGVEYSYPVNKAECVSPQTPLIVTLSKQDDLGHIEFVVIGSLSGRHAGSKLISDKTVIFTPDTPFADNEVVQVSVYSVNTLAICQYSFKTAPFLIAEKQSLPKPCFPQESAPVRLINDVAVPFDFPEFKSIISTGEADDGLIFLTNLSNTPYCMIVKNDGTPYYFNRMDGVVQDFKIQPNGFLTYFEYAHGRRYCALDSSFQHCKTFKAAYGYETDEHDFLWLENGNYLLIGYATVPFNLAPWIPGAREDAEIEICCVQEYNADDNIVFQWRSCDFINFDEAEHNDFRQQYIDYVHINSVAVDYDDNLIISCRHISQVLKVERTTGRILWRLGGKKNDFNFLNDEPFSFQHDARPVPGKPNHYTVFDNGNYHEPPYSRAVEYVLDTEQMTAQNIWEYRMPQSNTTWMGNAQRLPNGNTFINWADRSLPKATEVTPQGKVVYEGDFVIKDHCYRAFRFDCNYSTIKPSLFLEPLGNQVSLIFNKFGDTTIDHYIVYAGLDSTDLNQVENTMNTFSIYDCTVNNCWCYFKVCAVSRNGEKTFSDIEKFFLNYVPPNENILKNGDFSQGIGNWKLLLFDPAKADYFINPDGEMVIDVYQKGDLDWHVSLVQENIPLLYGKTYLFEFDANVDEDKLIVAKIERNGSPFENYGKIGLTQISPRQRHYSYEFVMEEQTNLFSRIVFTCGLDTNDLTLDNISLVQVEENVQVDKVRNEANIRFLSNFPNPFNNITTIQINLPQAEHVKVAIYNALGRQVVQLADQTMPAGTQELHWNGTDASGQACAGGLYFCTVEYEDMRQTCKIMLMK